MRHVISPRKGMLSGAFVMILFSLSIVGCKKESTEEITKRSINDIHKDPLFQDYVSKIQIQYNAVQDYTQLANIIKDGKISNEEANLMYKVYGYNNNEEFRFAYIRLAKIMRQLWKKYDFNAYTNEEKKEAVLKTFEQISNKNKFHSKPVTLNFIFDDCEKIRVNCILSVAAEATIMHLGCAALDVTFIFGILCHGTSILYQKTAGDNCNLAANKCKTT
jgi:hypothetical protein